MLHLKVFVYLLFTFNYSVMEHDAQVRSLQRLIMESVEWAWHTKPKSEVSM